MFEVLDAVSDLALVVDDVGRIRHLNAAAEITGWARRDAEGLPLQEIFTLDDAEDGGLDALLAGEVMDEAVHATLRHRRGTAVKAEARALSIDSPDGRPGRWTVLLLRPLEGSADFTSYPGRAPSTPAPGVNQEQIYKRVFDSAPLGLLHFDERGVITAANARFGEIVAASNRTLIGLDITTLPNEGLVSAIGEALGGRAAVFEGEYTTLLTGKKVQARAIFEPTRDDEGRVTGGVCMVEDVTERRSAERRLGISERMASLGSLAAGVAHEINNPLAFVLTGVDLSRRLVESLPSEVAPATLARLRDTLADVNDGIERVRIIARDLKTFARAADERREPVDIEEVLDVAAKLTRAELRHRARLHRDYGDVPPVWGSEPRLVQVFVNLLLNAARAIDDGDLEGNTISLVTRSVGAMVQVEVRDTGSGIAKEDLDRIFEPFWTGHGDRGGAGLGLSICHGIVTSHGGEITAESELGKGSVFRVTLPRSEDGATTERAERLTLRSFRSPRRLRVLVIDDEEALCRTLQMGLEDAHDVAFASSGKEGLARIVEDDSFDVVLCDLMLPDLPGPDLYEAAVEASPALATRFVFMTGGAFTERAATFLQSVHNPRLEKPFSLAELEGLLSDWR